MKRKVIAALLAAVLVMGSSMSVLAADETESISDKINVVNSMEEDMVEGELQDAVGESVSVSENYEESGENADIDNSETAGNLEEPVELAENAGDSNTYHEIDANGLLWDLADGVLTISGNGAIEDNPEFREYMRNTGTGLNSPLEPEDDGSRLKVVIEKGITEIGDYAFKDYYGINEVSIPDTVTKIGDSAFSYCVCLEEVFLPDSVKEIEDRAFFVCLSLKSIVIPDGVTKIKSATFSCCGLTEISIPDSVTVIDDHAFNLCSGLTKVSVPDGLTEIGAGAFTHCVGLTKIEIPNGVTKIEYSAFYGCKQLMDVTIPDSVKSIDRGAFWDCEGLQSVVFRGNMPEIGNGGNNHPWIDGHLCEPFDGVTATAYYPTGNVTYTEELKSAFGAGLTWEERDMPNMSFTDVNKGAWYYNSVDFVFFRGIMTGMNDSEFGPSITLSRAQFATILYRMQGEPQMEYDETAFGDVKDKEFYTSAAMWAKSTGVIKGYENGNFGPSDPITREQMAVMMFRYADEVLKLNTSVRGNVDEFPDAGEVSSFAEQEIQWAVGEGLIRGNQGKVDPQGSAERAQCATIVMRFMNAYGL